MGGEIEGLKDVRPRRAVARKPEIRPERSKAKRTVILSADAWERLTVHANRWGLDKSALVEKLINDQLRQYVVQDRGGRPPEGRSASGEDQVNLSGEGVPVRETASPFPADNTPAPAGEGEGSGVPDGPPRPTARRRPQPADG